MYQDIVDYIRNIYHTDKVIPLHAPLFVGNEKVYINDAIDSTFVSSVGKYVNRFEEMMCEITGASYAVATVNGTCALHVALRLLGVEQGDEVITQPLSFVATANAIAYCGARPIFVDVERKTLGLCPEAVEDFLKRNAQIGRDGSCCNKMTKKRIAACVPMHTFGHPCRIDAINEICGLYNIPVLEDAAESLGSLYMGRHAGTFGKAGIYSFNGNKTVTCGAGGAIVTNDPILAKRAKHITTTAKVPHPFEYVHDEVGYNYRMANLNAALACAQLEQLERFIANKRLLAQSYARFFENQGVSFFEEPQNCRSNYWLNAVILPDIEARDQFLEFTNGLGIMTRPVWRLMNKLPMFKESQTGSLENSQWLEERVVNIPSSVTL